MKRRDKHDRLPLIQLDACRPLWELVAETLREAIQNGKLQPGARLMEIQLAEELGVSRTPIREAIRELEADGYVVMIPRRGAYVADISLKDIAQVFEIRSALEELAAGLAVERITEDELEELERLLLEIRDSIERQDFEAIIAADVKFHQILYEASRNTRLIEIINNLRDQVLRFRSVSLHYPGRLEATWQEHRDLVEAIADRNAARAMKIAIRHMENSEKTLLMGIEEDGNAAAYIQQFHREKTS